jgi:hypothetical protein
MKTTLVLTALIFSTSLFATPKNFEACSANEVKDIEKDIIAKRTEGKTAASLIKNKEGKVLGFFASDKKDDIYAEICESMVFQYQMTTASWWYYWDSEDYKADASTWAVGVTYPLSQDEGRAYFKLLKASKTGNVTVEFSVIGWEEEDEIVLRKEIVTLVPTK